MAGDRSPAEALSRAFGPFGFGDRIGFGGQIVVEDELTDLGPFGHPPDGRHIGVQIGHALQREAGQTLSLEVAEVRNLVDEDVGSPGECDEVVVTPCRRRTPRNNRERRICRPAPDARARG
jgi:hypothetical protein